MTAIPHMDDTSIDAGVPWHFGEPFKEQRELVAGRGRVDLSHRGVVTVTGPDRKSWLHSITTQDFESPVAHLTSLILSPHGHIEHDIHVAEHNETVWISCEPGTVNELMHYLESMKFMLRVEVTDVSDQIAIVGAPGWIESDTYPVWHSSEAFVNGLQVSDKYVATRPADWKVSELFVPRDDLAQVLSQEPQIGTWAWEAHRIRAGVPRLNFETDYKTIPHEVGLIGSCTNSSYEDIARAASLAKQVTSKNLKVPGAGSPKVSLDTFILSCPFLSLPFTTDVTSAPPYVALIISMRVRPPLGLYFR